MNTLKNRFGYKELGLIIFFLLFGILSIIFRQELLFHPKLRSDYTIGTSENISDLIFRNKTGDEISAKEIISSFQSSWIFFFDPNCSACESLILQIRSSPSDNLISVSFVPVSFLFSYQKMNQMDTPLFSLHTKYAKLIGVTSVPCLIRVDNQGNIKEKILKYNIIESTLIKLMKH